MSEDDSEKVIAITIRKGFHILHVRTLESINTLVIVTNNKNIGLVPIIDEQLNDAVLCAAGILVFIHQEVEKLFLVLSKKILIFFKSFDDPIDHVIKIV